MAAGMRTVKFALGVCVLVALAACDASEQKAGPAPAPESKDGAKSSGAKTDAPEAPMVIRSPDNPYQ